MKLFTVREVAEILKFSRMSIWLWIRFGELKADKVGDRYVISKKDLLEFIEGTKKLSPYFKSEIKKRLMSDK